MNQSVSLRVQTTHPGVLFVAFMLEERHLEKVVGSGEYLSGCFASNFSLVLLHHLLSLQGGLTPVSDSPTSTSRTFNGDLFSDFE